MTIIHLGNTGYPAPHATDPEARTGHPQTLPYLVLHRMGFTQLLRSPEELVRSYRTVSPLPGIKRKIVCRQAVYFLLHLPSRYRDSTLWSILPYGVRTFLQSCKTTSDCLGDSDPRAKYKLGHIFIQGDGGTNWVCFSLRSSAFPRLRHRAMNCLIWKTVQLLDSSDGS